MATAIHRYELPVAEPYRLDLTVSVLRRLSTNVVGVLTPQGQYLRVLNDLGPPVFVRVAAKRLGSLSERGMLYYHLLLARLEARGEIGRASLPM